jgi:hypothetical protein
MVELICMRKSFKFYELFCPSFDNFGKIDHPKLLVDLNFDRAEKNKLACHYK